MISAIKKPDTESTGLYFSYLWAFTVERGIVIKKAPARRGRGLEIRMDGGSVRDYNWCL